MRKILSLLTASALLFTFLPIFGVVAESEPPVLVESWSDDPFLVNQVMESHNWITVWADTATALEPGVSYRLVMDGQFSGTPTETRLVLYHPNSDVRAIDWLILNPANPGPHISNTFMVHPGTGGSIIQLWVWQANGMTINVNEIRIEAYTQFVEPGIYTPYFNDPAEFTVTSQAITGRIDPFTFTMYDSVFFSDSPNTNQLISNGGFEPGEFRDMFQATEEHEHRIYASAGTLTHGDTFSDGFYDGGTAQIFRPRNGRLELVRHSTIDRFHASGSWIYPTWWQDIPEGEPTRRLPCL